MCILATCLSEIVFTSQDCLLHAATASVPAASTVADIADVAFATAVAVVKRSVDFEMEFE